MMSFKSQQVFTFNFVVCAFDCVYVRGWWVAINLVHVCFVTTYVHIVGYRHRKSLKVLTFTCDLVELGFVNFIKCLHYFQCKHLTLEECAQCSCNLSDEVTNVPW